MLLTGGTGRPAVKLVILYRSPQERGNDEGERSSQERGNDEEEGSPQERGNDEVKTDPDKGSALERQPL